MFIDTRLVTQNSAKTNTYDSCDLGSTFNVHTDRTAEEEGNQLDSTAKVR